MISTENPSTSGAANSNMRTFGWLNNIVAAWKLQLDETQKGVPDKKVTQADVKLYLVEPSAPRPSSPELQPAPPAQALPVRSLPDDKWLMVYNTLTAATPNCRFSIDDPNGLISGCFALDLDELTLSILDFQFPGSGTVTGVNELLFKAGA